MDPPEPLVLDGITVLFTHYLRAAFGHPANDRGEPFHTVRATYRHQEEICTP